MTRPRKLWATQYKDFPPVRHQSRAVAYEYVRFVGGLCSLGQVSILVDERDGLGWQVHERIDLAELARAGES